jgi:hypothetical protein
MNITLYITIDKINKWQNINKMIVNTILNNNNKNLYIKSHKFIDWINLKTLKKL